MTANLADDDSERQLDIGCVAAHGYYRINPDAEQLEIIRSDRSATAFLFDLIAMLQMCGTVPMIDVMAYAKWMPNVLEERIATSE